MEISLHSVINVMEYIHEIYLLCRNCHQETIGVYQVKNATHLVFRQSNRVHFGDVFTERQHPQSLGDSLHLFGFGIFFGMATKHTSCCKKLQDMENPKNKPHPFYIPRMCINSGAA